ncbi:MAG: hypothetical protein HQL86_09115 [Magnetococcales bacterium]|nr:hypothetical protein [Magnetococcales bacterium]
MNTTNPITLFNFESKQIRIITIDGEPWFVAKDVVEALGVIWNGAPAIKHVPEEWKGVRSDLTPLSPGGNIRCYPWRESDHADPLRTGPLFLLGPV